MYFFALALASLAFTFGGLLGDLGEVRPEYVIDGWHVFILLAWSCSFFTLGFKAAEDL